MKLDEAKKILNRNGFLIEKTVASSNMNGTSQSVQLIQQRKFWKMLDMIMKAVCYIKVKLL